MKRLIHRSALLFNAFLVAGLILSYLSVYINPKDFWIVALFGLAYPYLLALNLIMIIYWSVQLKKEILISLITILIGWNNLQNFIRPPVLSNLNSNRRESKTEYLKDTGNTVMIDFLSYNVRLFNYYKWLETPDAKDGILRLISERKPDILCLQEIFLTGEKGTLTIDGLRNKTGKATFSHVTWALSKKGEKNYGIATFSRFPIVNKGDIRFPNTINLSIFTDVKINNDTIRIYNNHLQSVRLRKKSYSFLKTFNHIDEEEAIDEIKDISLRLKHAFALRAKQAKVIARHIKNSPYPVMVCGDFNDTPVSYSYHKIRGKLKDAFVESGTGIGNTYLGRFPSYRIDYILHSDNIKSSHFKTIRVNYSDHYPVTCNLYLRPE